MHLETATGQCVGQVPASGHEEGQVPAAPREMGEKILLPGLGLFWQRVPGVELSVQSLQ